MRLTRNTVELFVDGNIYRAIFEHKHAKTDRTREVLLPVHGWVPDMDIEVKPGEDRPEKYVWLRDEYDEVVIEPILDGTVKLRHVTTCRLTKRQTDAPVFDEVGRGVSRCSTKDRYDWRKGIKQSLRAAITASGLKAQEGGFLGAFYSELRKRVQELVL